MTVTNASIKSAETNGSGMTIISDINQDFRDSKIKVIRQLQGWTEEEKFQLESIKRNGTFNDAIKDLMLSGNPIGSKYYYSDRDSEIQILQDIIDYFEGRAIFNTDDMKEGK